MKNLTQPLSRFSVKITAVVLFSLLVGQVRGDDITITASQIGGAGWGSTRDSQTGTYGGITAETTDGIYSTQLRSYASSTFTVSSAIGNMTSIVFTTSSGDFSSVSSGTYSSKTWSGDASSIEFSCTSQVRITQMVITYTSGGGSTDKTVTWYVNGTETTDGNPTTTVTLGGKVSTLPTSPVSSDCNGKSFVGWTNDEISGTTNTKPTVLFTTAAASPTISDDTDFFAVFAEASSGGSSTVSMNSFSATAAYVDDDENVSYAAGKGAASTNPAVNSSQIRIYQNGGTLTVTANNGKKLESVTIGSAMGTTISYSVDGGTASSNESLAANATMTVDDLDADEIVFTCNGTTSSTRLYLNYLEVTYSGGTSYSDYQTTCTASTCPAHLSADATSAVFTQSANTFNVSGVSWSATETGAKFDVYLTDDSSDTPSASISSSSLVLDNTSNTTTTFIGLAENKTYYLWLRRNCGSGDYSSWQKKAEFTTPYLNHTITVSNGSEGTYSLNPATGIVTSTQTAILTVSPNSGYSSSASVTAGTANISKSGNEYTITGVASDITVTITYAVKTSYTVTLIDAGSTRATDTAYDGDEYELPTTSISPCTDAVFVGWTALSFTNGTTSSPTILTDNPTITAATTFYAVYKTSDPDATGWTKMTETDEVAAGDKIAIVPHDNNYPYALYQETNGTTYIKYWEFDEDAIDDDDKNWVTVSSAGSDGWYLGDATNGYVYNSGSNNLAINSTNKTAFTIEWNSTGEAFTIEANTKYLSCRTDLTTANANNYRMGGANNGQIYLDLYRGGSLIYTNRPQCCTPPTTALNVYADKTEVIGSGVVTFTVEESTGNGKSLSWAVDGGLSFTSTSNTGATLNIPSAATTKTYTVTVSQPDDDTDADNVVCGVTKKIVITVKTEYEISFRYIQDSSDELFTTLTVADGAEYTMPDLSEDFSCPDGYSFAGWASSSSATAVEKTAGATLTASAAATWYALWSTSGGSGESVDEYAAVTDISQIAAGDQVIIAAADYWKAMSTDQRSSNRGAADIHEVSGDDTKTYFLSTDAVQVFTLGGNSTDGWSFYDGSNYIYAASSSNNNLKSQETNDENGLWDITISSGSTSVVAKGSNTRNVLQYNTSNLFSCYSSASQKAVMLYRRTGNSISVSSGSSGSLTTNTTCSRGATILAIGNKWITAGKGQKVKTVYNITAKGFDTAETLAIESNSDNSHFAVTLAASAVPVQPSQLATTLTIEYTPTEANTVNQTTIVLKAGEASRTITVSGRSLPDEFVIITKSGSKWYALPANMTTETDTRRGVAVVPDDTDNPTFVQIVPATAVYSMRSVAVSRYDAAGNLVRFVGNEDKCLWATSSDATDIRNYAVLGTTNGAQYEWMLTTENGSLYRITSPQNPGTGRMLYYNGTSFGLYKNTGDMYIVPFGCSSVPDNLQVSPAREQVTVSWESNASSFDINIYDADNDALVATTTVTSSPATVAGLTESHNYKLEIIPDGETACKVEDEFMTNGPSLEMVEWKENSVIIFVDKDTELHPKVIIAGEKEEGVESGTIATDIFFSKYFEAEHKAKMLGIYNGTFEKISLSDITILQRSTSKNTPMSVAGYGAKEPNYIYPGEEILFYMRGYDEIMECAEELDEFSDWNDVGTNSNLDFGGGGTIRMFRGNKCIDIIGAMESTATEDDLNDETVAPKEGDVTPPFGDKDGFYTTQGDNYTTKDVIETDYGLSTNRCLLVRKASVANGDSAILNNFGDFKTLGVYTGVDGLEHKGEWSGLQIPTTTSAELAAHSDWKKYHYTCEGFAEVGGFDYNSYYREYQNIGTPLTLDDKVYDAEQNLYELSIPNVAQYSCLGMKFQLTDDGGNVLTEQTTQVPILVAADHSTTDDLFSDIIHGHYENSKARCKTCNVVVFSGATLTKATNGAANDVNQVRDIKLYPGGKLVVPASGSDYKINSLSFRRQEDEISSADIQANIDIAKTNGVYLDVRVDAQNWHWLSLPYDCNVADVAFANGDEAIYNTDWFLMYYDGEQRANTQKGGCWKVYEDPVIHAGQGLIVGIQGNATKPKIKQELRFPMANDAVAAERDDKTLDVYAWGVGNETLNPSDQQPEEHFGWNLVGNPYMNYYHKGELNSFGGLTLGRLLWDESGTNTYYNNGDGIAYIAVPVDGGWRAYEQKTVSGNDLLPFTSYFVQVGNAGSEVADEQLTVLFDNTKRGRSSIVRRQSQDEEQETPALVGVYLTSASNEQDETALVISDRFEDRFELGRDMYKWFGDYYKYYTKPVVYTISPTHKLAFNALPEATATGQVPVGYYAGAAGTYTFSLNRKSDLQRVEEVWLYDATEDVHTNLMQADYQFYSKKEQNENRFFLSVRLAEKQTETPTDADNLSGSGIVLTTDEGMLTLTGLPENAQVWIYSANGSLVANETTHAWQRCYKLPTGVYNVRIVADEALTLRGIVK